MITVYTDGSSRNSSEGWVGATATHIYEGDDLIYEDVRVVKPATNNVAELLAVVNAIVYCQKRGIKRLHVVTDSGYVITGFKRLANGETHQTNMQEWQLTAQIAAGMTITFAQVKGHVSGGTIDNEKNNKVDKLAYNKLRAYFSNN